MLDLNFECFLSLLLFLQSEVRIEFLKCKQSNEFLSYLNVKSKLSEPRGYKVV